MQITRVYAGPDGQVVFGRWELKLRDTGANKLLSKRWVAGHLQFLEAPAGCSHDWPPTGERQLLIVLDGEVEILVPDQSSRRLGPGSVVLFEEVSGARLHIPGMTTFRALLVTLSDDEPIDEVLAAGEESFPASDPPSWTSTAAT